MNPTHLSANNPTTGTRRRRTLRCALLIAVGLLAASCQSPKQAPTPTTAAAPLIQSLPLRELNGTEVYNASAVVPLADGRFLFCDDHTPDALYELNLTPSGQLQGALIRQPLQGLKAETVDDLEGMTVAEEQGHRFVFAASSLSLKKFLLNPNDKPGRVAAEGLLRITMNADHGLSAENMPGFRAWLIQQMPDLAEAAQRAPNEQGLNIEGLAWDRQRHALLFGLRTPVPGHQPLVLAVKVKDLAAPWTTSNLEMLPALHLNAPTQSGEQGIRSLEYIEELNAYLVILGRVSDDAPAPYTLCLWDGQATGTLQPLPLTFDAKMKPEGITAGTVGGKSVLLFVDDTGGYQMLPLETLTALRQQMK